MESTVVGIASVESKPINTKRGPSTVYTITDALGIDYTTFDRDIAAAAAARKGQSASLSFNTKQNTKPNNQGVSVTYTNRYLESVESADSEFSPSPVLGSAPASRGELAATADRGVSVTGLTYIPASSDKDQSIARAVALKAAVELVASGVVEGVNGGTVTGGDVLLLAKYLEPYLLGHDAPTETSVGVDSPPPYTDDDVPF